MARSSGLMPSTTLAPETTSTIVRLRSGTLGTDVIDKRFLDKNTLFSCCARTTAWREAGAEVRALLRSPYRRISFAASVRAFFGPLEFQPATKRV